MESRGVPLTESWEGYCNDGFAIVRVAYAAYKLRDYLVGKLDMKNGTSIAIGFFFFGMLIVAWLNGIPFFGESDECFGSGVTSTC